jgi:copper(I)-binding protein
MNRIVSSAILAALVLQAPASASPAITVSGAYSRPATDMGAVFLKIENAGKDADRLDRAASEVAGATEVHESYAVDGGEAMRHVPYLEIPAGKTVTLKSGGYHIMLIGLRHDLQVGQHFTIRLHFAGAGWVDVPVEVKSF